MGRGQFQTSSDVSNQFDWALHPLTGSEIPPELKIPQMYPKNAPKSPPLTQLESDPKSVTLGDLD